MIKLCWTRAHVGNVGNECADKLAKSALNIFWPNYKLQLPFSYFKLLIRKDLINEWQEYWNNSDKGRITYGFFPTVSTKRCVVNFVKCQIFTGHGIFSLYQERFFNKPNLCHCGDAPSTLEHIIFDCSLLTDLRTSDFNLQRPRSGRALFRFVQTPSLFLIVEAMFLRLLQIMLDES